VYDLSVKVATEAAKRKVDKFIEVSTAQVYEAGKKKAKEGMMIILSLLSCTIPPFCSLILR
jgi:hypothetical protein